MVDLDFLGIVSNLGEWSSRDWKLQKGMNSRRILSKMQKDVFKAGNFMVKWK